MWSKILDFLQTDIGRLVISILCSLVAILVAALFRWLANKTKNKRLRKLLSVAADAISFAENKGGTPQEKLDTAVSYLQSQVPKSNKSDCKLVIETAVECTKTDVNRQQERRSSTSVMTTRRKI